jgi:hypothetical protein
MVSQELGVPPESPALVPNPRRQRSGAMLARDLVLALSLKVALVLALYLFLVRPVMHPDRDPVATAAAVAGSATPQAEEVRP